MFRSEPFDATLVEARMLSPSVRELVLERVDDKPFLFLPGQWVNLVLPVPEGEIRRAYSVASAPTARGSRRFEVAVTRVAGGPGSQYLHALPPGSVLRAIGPQGLFTRAASDESPSLFIATGTGVTPLRSMLQSALAAGSRAQLSLLFGARFEDDILYRAEFEAYAREHPHFRYAVTLSQGAASWGGLRGYVQLHVREALGELRASASPLEPHLYVCGLERMVKTVRELSRGELSVERKHVHTERYD
jgi:CDP-4-dehydro-6-deoxyglucose reductase, E3